MKFILVFAIVTAALASSAFASEIVDAKCHKSNSGVSVSITDNGVMEEGMPLKKLVHKLETDASVKEVKIIDNLQCSYEDGSYIYFSNKTADKFFLLIDEETKAYAIQIIAQTSKVKKAVKEAGLARVNGELGEVFVVTGLECKFE